MMKKIISILFAMGAIFFTYKCKKENNLEQKINEAVWMYYESNFMKGKVRCIDNDTSFLSVCFIDGFEIDTTYYGDTLEVRVFAKTHKGYCSPQEGMTLCIMGFYPQSKTVNYRRSIGTTYLRTKETDTTYTGFEWAGIYSMSKQKEMFKDFIQKNADKINPWLKKEAKKRGYI